MRTIQDAYDLAVQRGYLPLRSDTQWLAAEPLLLTELQQPAGFTNLAAKLGYPIPSTVQEFWKLPDLVRLIDSWRWQDYLFDPPEIIFWDEKPNLVVCTHPCSGGVGAVLLTPGDDDSPLNYGFANEPAPIEWRKVPMTEHVFSMVEQGSDSRQS